MDAVTHRANMKMDVGDEFSHSGIDPRFKDLIVGEKNAEKMLTGTW